MDFHFEKEDAIKYGVEEAILLYNLKFWIRKNKANNINFIDGHYWTYNSCNSFAKLFPFWNIQKIGRLLRELEEKGVIKSGNYNNNKMDKSKWYCILNETFMEDLEESSNASDCSETNNDCSKMNNQSLKNEQSIYTYNKPYNKQHIKENSKRKNFQKPTVEEIKDYIKKLGVNIDAEKFYYHYESKGWLIGKSPMKSWKAAINTWVKNSGQEVKKSKTTKTETKKINENQEHEKALDKLGIKLV